MAKQAKIVDFEHVKSTSSKARSTSERTSTAHVKSNSRSSSNRSSSGSAQSSYSRSGARSTSSGSSKSSIRAGHETSQVRGAHSKQNANRAAQASKRNSKASSAGSISGASEPDRLASQSSRSMRNRHADQGGNAPRESTRNRHAGQDGNAPRESTRNRDEQANSGFRNIGDAAARKQREARKKRADREFDKHFKEDTSSQSSEEGPRAALYKGQMGRTQKRSSGMQRNASAQSARSQKVRGDEGRYQSRRTTVRIVGIVAACLVLSLAFLYPTAKDYYTAVRDQARAQAEYDIVEQQTSLLQSNVDHLSTNEGIEDRAREQYGWVNEGENAVVVTGLGNTSNDSQVTSVTAHNNVTAPETWYSGILDVVFDYPY